MGSLLRERDFRLLFVGQGISAVGTAVTYVALPLIAVTTLSATPFEVGLITAAGYAAWLLVGLPLGVYVDRRKRRPLLIFADLGRAALLATVTAAALADALTIVHLVLVALLAGALSVLFDVAYPAYLPAIIPKDKLVDGNGKLFATESAAHVAGPGLGGALLQAAGAALTVLVDVVSFLISALTLRMIRSPEPEPKAAGTTSVGRELADGLRYTLGRPLTRAIMGAGVTGNLAFGGYLAIVVVFLYDTLGLGEAVVGVLLGAASAGAVVGSLVTGPLARVLGDARLTWMGPCTYLLWGALIVLAAPGWRVALFAVGAFGLSAVVGSFNVCARAAIQSAVPGELLGRTTASLRLFTRGTLPLGALAAGALATVASPRVAITVLMALLLLSPLWLRMSPVGRVRTLEELSDVPDKVSP